MYNIQHGVAAVEYEKNVEINGQQVQTMMQTMRITDTRLRWFKESIMMMMVTKEILIAE